MTAPKTADASRIKNKCVVLVGTLHGMSRADAKTAITAAGGHWRDTITCKTELIVLGLFKPSALEKADETAEQKQIDTITGNELSRVQARAFDAHRQARQEEA